MQPEETTRQMTDSHIEHSTSGIQYQVSSIDHPGSSITSLRDACGMNGLPKVALTHFAGSGAEVYLHGGHITSWTDRRGEERFFVSRESLFEAGRPIRGGIPIIFPQFGGGSLPQHGIARTREWRLKEELVHSTGDVEVKLQLTSTPETMAVWPYQFDLTLGVLLGADQLTVSLLVENTGDQPFDFKAALHTYFAVADIHRTALHGLEGVTYIDSLRDSIRVKEDRSVIRFAEETDRIYVNAPDILSIDDGARNQPINIHKTNMPDVVVWNPWIAKSQRMADFGDDEYLRMVCVETGSIAEFMQLAPHDRWRGETVFDV
jgi:glucose-6-phosphate 1-epimerase